MRLRSLTHLPHTPPGARPNIVQSLAMDTLAYAKRLKQAGFDQAQAEALAEGLRDATTATLATKQDLAELETRLTRLMLIQGAAVVTLVVTLVKLL